jgi:acyl carrier protein
MDINQFIAALAPAFVESGSLLTPETNYKDLSDWNSLTTLMVFTTIGQQFNVSLEVSDLYEAETIEQLYNIVRARQ